jgi:hypothetical protein
MATAYKARRLQQRFADFDSWLSHVLISHLPTQPNYQMDTTGTKKQNNSRQVESRYMAGVKGVKPGASRRASVGGAAKTAASAVPEKTRQRIVSKAIAGVTSPSKKRRGEQENIKTAANNAGLKKAKVAGAAAASAAVKKPALASVRAGGANRRMSVRSAGAATAKAALSQPDSTPAAPPPAPVEAATPIPTSPVVTPAQTVHMHATTPNASLLACCLRPRGAIYDVAHRCLRMRRLSRSCAKTARSW